MKQKRLTAIFLAFILLIACLPTGSAQADELAEGQIIADGVYYIQNIYTGYYMQVADGRTAEDTPVSQMDKNLGDEDVDSQYYLSLEFDIRNMWKVQYLGNGKYTLHSMAKLDMALTKSDSSSTVLPGVTIKSSGSASWPLSIDMIWSIELDENGYYLQRNGSDAATLYAPNPNRSTHPYLLTSDYDADVLNCHWTFITPDKELLLYKDLTYTDDIDVTVTPDEVLTLEDLGIQVQTCPGIYANQAISWTSSNPNTATVDSATGTITAISFGATLITASCIVNGLVCSAQYNLSVSLKEAPHLIQCIDSPLYLSAPLENISTGELVTFSPTSDEIAQRWFLDCKDTYYTIRLELSEGSYYLGYSPVYDSDSEDVVLYTETNNYTKWNINKLNGVSGFTISIYTSSNNIINEKYLSIVNNDDTGLELKLCPYSSSNMYKWSFKRMPYINLQVYYDSYVSAYGGTVSNGIANIEDQIVSLQQTYWDYFGITVNVVGPTYISTYIDECPTYDTTGVCNCGTCTSSLSNDTSQQYHHSSFANILSHLPPCEANIDAVVLFIGHPACGISDNGEHDSHYALGVTYPYYNLLCVNNIGTYENGTYQYNHQDCTRTFIHEVGHLFFAPDHYGDPSTEEINTTGNYVGTFSPLCIYGEFKSQAAEELVICEGCAYEIFINRDRYTY